MPLRRHRDESDHHHQRKAKERTVREAGDLGESLKQEECRLLPGRILDTVMKQTEHVVCYPLIDQLLDCELLWGR